MVFRLAASNWDRKFSSEFREKKKKGFFTWLMKAVLTPGSGTTVISVWSGPTGSWGRARTCREESQVDRLDVKRKVKETSGLHLSL